MYGHRLLYSRVISINRVRLPNLLVVSSTGKLSVVADASVVSTYICTGTVLLFVFVYRSNSQACTRTGEYYFPCSADHEQDWQPYPVDPYSAICDDHTYIHTRYIFILGTCTFVHGSLLYIPIICVTTAVCM